MSPCTRSSYGHNYTPAACLGNMLLQLLEQHSQMQLHLDMTFHGYLEKKEQVVIALPSCMAFWGLIRAYCSTNNLSILSTLFSHYPRRLFTWKSPDGKLKNQIDFIIINQKWQSSVKNIKSLAEADCNGDHQLLVADIKIRLKRLQKNSTPLRLDFSTIDNEYRIQLDNGFMSLLAC